MLKSEGRIARKSVDRANDGPSGSQEVKAAARRVVDGVSSTGEGDCMLDDATTVEEFTSTSMGVSGEV